MKVFNLLAGLLTLASFAAAVPPNHRVKSGTTIGTRQVVSINPTAWFLATKRAGDVADTKDCITASVVTTLTDTVSLVLASVSVSVPDSVSVSGTSTTTDCITCITGPPQTYEVHGPTGSVRSSRDAAFRAKQKTETWVCGVWVPKASLTLLGGTAGVCASASASDLSVALGLGIGKRTVVTTTTVSDMSGTELPDCPALFGCMDDPVSRSSYYSKMSSKSAASVASGLKKIATTTSYASTTDLPDCPALFGCMNDPVSRSSYHSKMSSKSAASVKASKVSATKEPCTETPLMVYANAQLGAL